MAPRAEAERRRVQWGAETKQGRHKRRRDTGCETSHGRALERDGDREGRGAGCDFERRDEQRAATGATRACGR